MRLDFKIVGGPYGDATSKYEVTFPEGITVREFVSYIVDDYSVNSGDNWGAFEIHDDNYTFGLVQFLQYNRGKAFYEEPWTNKERGEAIFNSIADVRIIKITAHGGWSNMNYILTLEGGRTCQ